jgi:hypothetical protein
MTSSRLFRRWTLLLLLYIVADFADPSIPGVFFFDSGALFIDGVVQVKSSASDDVTVAQPTPLRSTVACHDEHVFAKARIGARPSLQRPVRWPNVKRDDSASFASSAEPDSAPTPPLA